jgi:hypothetical protein
MHMRYIMYPCGPIDINRVSRLVKPWVATFFFRICSLAGRTGVHYDQSICHHLVAGRLAYFMCVCLDADKLSAGQTVCGLAVYRASLQK